MDILECSNMVILLKRCSHSVVFVALEHFSQLSLNTMVYFV